MPRLAALAVGVFSLIAPLIVRAQSVAAPASGRFEIPALRAVKPPVIDGEVADEEWQSAAVVTDFIQFEPRQGDPSEVRTEALVLYDSTHLYVAFRAWDAEPITAQLTQRDVDLLRDDAVAVLLDTTFDRRSGYRNRLSTRVNWAEEFKLFEKEFRNRQVALELGYNTREYLSVAAGVEFGRHFDADFVLWTTSARYKVTPQLSAEYSLERLSWIPIRGWKVPRSTSYGPISSSRRTCSCGSSSRPTPPSTATTSRRCSWYRYLPPFGTLQLAYQRGTAAFGQRSTQGDTLFLKGTTVF